MRKIVLLLTIFLFILNISASCKEGQININTASLEELDKLSGIGSVKAQAIIDTRPFNSVNDLINVSGIGEVTLNNIISQRLACVVDQEKEDDEEEKNETEKPVNNKTNINNESSIKENIEIKDSIKKVELIRIELNPKDIKSENSSESLKRNYAIYGLIAFSILIVILLLLRKNKYKNEFR